MADAPSGAPIEGGGGAPSEVTAKKLTPKELRLLERSKAAAERAAKESSGSADVYGERSMVQSTEITGKVWTR